MADKFLASWFVELCDFVNKISLKPVKVSPKSKFCTDLNKTKSFGSY